MILEAEIVWVWGGILSGRVYVHVEKFIEGEWGLCPCYKIHVGGGGGGGDNVHV